MLNDTDAACVAIALALCLNMLSDTDAACVATALALCLKGKRIAAGPTNVRKGDHNAHTQKSHDRLKAG
jgi:hypothetical protein